MSGAEIARVSERALLVRFHDAELGLAVAKAQALWSEAKKLEAERQRDERLPLKGKGQDDALSEGPPWPAVTGDEESKAEARDERLSLKGKDRTEASPAQALWSEAKGEGKTKTNDERRSLMGRGQDGGLFRRIVLGAGSLLVELDALAEAGEIERLAERLGSLAKDVEREIGATGGPLAASAGREHRVAVRFGGEEGPDLGAVADEAGVSQERVVALLCGAELRVAFVGFAPGFPYLIGLPRELELSRLASPRARVPAGSVAIAGPFAGVYPSSTPGGWRLLGRLAAGEAPLFDPRRDPPARCAAGDRVRFVDAAGASSGT